MTDLKFSRNPEKLIPIILIIVPVILYGQTLMFEFVWDDGPIHLTANPYINEMNPDNLTHIWTKTYEGLYIPVSYTILGLLKPLGGDRFNPFPYHLLNLVLHIINGLLIYKLLKLFIKSKWTVLIGTLVFITHPVQAEAVSWVSESRGLLAAVSGFGALYLYLLSTVRGSKSYYTISTILFILSILSKPASVIIPFFAFILAHYLKRRDSKRNAIRLTPWLLSVIPVILITKFAQSEPIDTVPVSAWIRPFIWLDTINFYLLKLIYPLDLGASYGRTPEFLAGSIWLYTGWIIPAVIAVLLWKSGKKRPLLGISFLLFIIGYFPVSGLVPSFFQVWSTVADRYLYFSMFGVSLAIASILSINENRKTIIIAITIISALGLRNYLHQIPTWRNNFTLWSHCLEINPNEHKAHFNLGNYHSRTGNQRQAVIEYSKAVQIKPDYENAYLNRGNIHLGSFELDKAYNDFSKVISLNPGNAEAWNSRGNIGLEKRNYEQSLSDYNKAVEINPQYSDAFYNRGNLYLETGNIPEAIDDYTEAIKQDPGNFQAYGNRGIARYRMKEYEKAIKDYTRAYQLEPRYVEALNNRALVFYYMGKLKEARDDLKQVQNTNPRMVNQSLLKKLSGQ